MLQTFSPRLPDEDDLKEATPAAWRPHPDEIRRAAFDLLARREHSQQELLGKLTRKFMKRMKMHGVTANVLRETAVLIESVLQTIAAEGLQSDRRYVEMLVSARIHQGHGPIRIAQELKSKGIPASAYEELLERDREEWRERAKQVKQKKFGTGKVLSQKEKARQMHFLQYRGFGSEHIRHALQ